jgi:hypothetical protein
LITTGIPERVRSFSLPSRTSFTSLYMVTLRRN